MACTIDNADNPVKLVGIAIDETNFPDAAFRQCLFDYYKFAKDGILTDEETTLTQRGQALLCPNSASLKFAAKTGKECQKARQART